MILLEIRNYFMFSRNIIRALHSSTSLQEVLNVVVTKSADVLDAKGALLRILNKETEPVRCAGRLRVGRTLSLQGTCYD